MGFRSFFNVGDAALGAAKAPIDSARAMAGATGPFGRIAAGAASIGGAAVRVPAAVGLRAAQGVMFLATPLVAIGGGIFAAQKISEHLEHKEQRDFLLPKDDIQTHTQTLIDQNPMDVNTAQAINAQMQQMMAAQNHISAASASHEGLQEEQQQQLA